MRLKRQPADRFFRQKDLTTGMFHELEHTSDPRLAKIIAKAHLKEDKEYYRKLARCMPHNPLTESKLDEWFYGLSYKQLGIVTQQELIPRYKDKQIKWWYKFWETLSYEDKWDIYSLFAVHHSAFRGK